MCDKENELLMAPVLIWRIVRRLEEALEGTHLRQRRHEGRRLAVNPRFQLPAGFLDQLSQIGD